MPSQQVLALLTTSQDVGDLSFANWGKGRVSREVAKLVEGLGDGAFTGSIDIQNAPSYAYGILLVSGGAGADGGTIGGKLVTAAFAVSDANTADLIAAAILADTTANTYCSATSRAATGTVTLTASSGTITVTIGGGVPGTPSQTISLVWATSDTATAAAIVAAINALQNCPVVASSAAGVVTLYSTLPGTGATNTGGNQITLAATGTNVTVSGALLTTGGTSATVLIKGLVPGTIGNGITLVASGTGVTAPTGARLVGGVGAPGNSFAC